MAFIQPGKKAVLSAILCPKTSSVLTKYLIRRVKWKYNRLRQILCIQINFSWFNTNHLYRYHVNIVCVQPCFVIPLNLNIFSMTSFKSILCFILTFLLPKIKYLYSPFNYVKIPLQKQKPINAKSLNSNNSQTYINADLYNCKF